MKLAIGLAAFLCLACLAPVRSLAGSWSGYLVDSKCYEIEEQNVNPWDVSDYVGRDRDLEKRLCSPNTKTKLFAVVPADWQGLKLDSTGNAKAAELVRKAGKKSVLEVTVTGEKNKAGITVDSISIATFKPYDAGRG